MQYNQKIIDLVNKLSKKRKTQNKFYTYSPIYLVQIRKEKIVDPKYEQVEIERIYISGISNENNYYPTLKDIKGECLRNTSLPCELVMEAEECETMKDVSDLFKKYFKKGDKYYDVEILNISFEWETVAYFALEEEAKNYQKYQAHNLGINRLYVVSPGYDNRGALADLLRSLDEEDFILEKS